MTYSVGDTRLAQRSATHGRGHAVATLAKAGTGKAVAAARPRQRSNPLTEGLVTVLTEGLRLAGVGADRYAAASAAPPRNARPLRGGDVAGLMGRLRQDFKQAYFVTGVLDDSIYDPDCFFADPTVAFTGVDLWRRNLALLVPFLEGPSVQLRGLRRLGRQERGAEGAEVLRAEWTLRTVLRLPWRPLIDIEGATEYTLNEESNRIVRHVEFWSVSGTEALLQLLRPGPQLGR